MRGAPRRRHPDIDEALVATDHPDIVHAAVSRAGGNAVLTGEHPSGTDRCHAAWLSHGTNAADHAVVNLQGDEPFPDGQHIAALCRSLRRSGDAVATVRRPAAAGEVDFPNASRSNATADGRALRFSRHPVPPLAGPTTSTSACTALHPAGWNAAHACPSVTWSRQSGWNNCAGWKPECPFTSWMSKRQTDRVPWTRRRPRARAPLAENGHRQGPRADLIFAPRDSAYFARRMSLSPQSNFLLNALPLLLHDHDCLVIPGMGGFVAHPVPARFDEDKGEWIPPGRDVLFNPKLTVRDGLLEQEIRRATGLLQRSGNRMARAGNRSPELHPSARTTRDPQRSRAPVPNRRRNARLRGRTPTLESAMPPRACPGSPGRTTTHNLPSPRPR